MPYLHVCVSCTALLCLTSLPCFDPCHFYVGLFFSADHIFTFCLPARFLLWITIQSQVCLTKYLVLEFNQQQEVTVKSLVIRCCHRLVFIIYRTSKLTEWCWRKYIAKNKHCFQVLLTVIYVTCCINVAYIFPMRTFTFSLKTSDLPVVRVKISFLVGKHLIFRQMDQFVS